ncbi:MAG: hypothetical protein HS108_14545 [Planctomycetes bacterium]|nr:hypothetical protein [Planctomycetota bacterium]
MSADKVQEIVCAIYRHVGELEKLFPGRHFTPDGHMVGSIGECLAAYHYGLELMPASAAGHDAKSPDGRLVQVKATQKDRIAISSEPDYLIVLKLKPDGTSEEIYNGLGGPVWEMVKDKPLPKNGQYQVPLSKLKKLTQAEGYKPAFMRVR